jgi:glutamate dehydrogenase
MSIGLSTSTSERIDEVIDLAEHRLGDQDREQVVAFLRLFYEGVPERDLQARRVENLYGAAMTAWHGLQQRQVGSPSVEVYTPDPEQHGWQSTHSVVEILTDDMPFLVDSVTMELSRQDLGIHLAIYPMVDVRRDDDGQLQAVFPRDSDEADTVTEALVHVEIDRQTEPSMLASIRESLLQVLSDVRAVVDDWQAMREQLHDTLTRLDDHPPPVDDDECAEAKAFLAWLDDDHFTFVGFRVYDLERRDEGDVIVARTETGLGILRDAPRSEKHLAEQPEEVGVLARERKLLNLTKANSASTVHRPSYLDYVGVKRFDDDGEVVGETRFLGLYTSRVYSARPEEIPVVRRKVEAVLDRASFPRDTHDAKDLTAILEAYPRDELFEVSADELFELSMGVLGLQERRRVRLFLRRDRYGRYFSCLVFVPRDHYTTKVRLRLQEVLREAFDATGMEHSVRLSESVLARLHFIVHARPGQVPTPDVEELEHRLADAARDWADDLEVALIEELGEERGTRLYRRYGDAFPAAYREDYPPRIAVADVDRLERLDSDTDLGMNLHRPVEAHDGFVRFKLYRSGAPSTLSQVLPVLENMGFEVIDQRPYEIRAHDSSPQWIHDYGLRFEPGALSAPAAREAFQDAFARVWHGDNENDGFNRLVLGAGLPWRDITVLRAYSRYLRQTETRYSLDYMQDALVDHPAVTRRLRGLFHARFDPDQHDPDRADELVAEIEDALDEVSSLDEDRILRNVMALILATLRTNHFRTDADGRPKTHLTLKFDPAGVPDLPRPRPAFEIFVHSPRTEGVHLRGGRVARGGLRWSNRREDFRTEVLDLTKAQTVKNAVIVPVGAKGGFVVKTHPVADADPQDYRDEVQECYRTFIRGLLDVTDNIVEGDIVPPTQVIRYDDDDPYLVVAADKGTASFSDTANEISLENDFWLGDAFASGGSAGYDHKAMAITARGAWVSVRRHFRELGLDTQPTKFPMIGIGDMSGDVFGNGMLLSRHIRLVAAFDHRHIFIDPDPDAATSYEERQRLFDQPRSTWESYDRDLISEGGGVWPRTAKSIPLSDPIRALLDLPDPNDAGGAGNGGDVDRMSPDELVSALLRAPVDLLFNGGVGTFVKASDQTHADVGDKTTDRVRVDATELRCKVVGEGGNLGLTQRARIEYALGGGHINTDAIDNAAGVDCSDHEVNIKILLDAMVRSEDLTGKQRNELLVEMTDEVTELVLRNNEAQVQALTNANANALAMVEVSRRYIDHLESLGRLDRHLEALPTDEELQERRGRDQALTRPEFAVLLAYTKTLVYDELVASDLPDDPWMARELEAYMPSALRERFPERLHEHRLRREIIATQAANALVNDAGTTFLYRIADETGAGACDIARAYLVAREVFDLHGIQRAVRDLDVDVPAEAQTAMVLEARRLVERGTRWLLRNCRRPLDIGETIEAFAPGASTVGDLLAEHLRGGDHDAAVGTARELEGHGVPGELAGRLGHLPWLVCALDLVTIAEDDDVDEPIPSVTEMYFALAERLHLDWLREQIAALPRTTRWETLARDALREDFFAQHSALTAEVLRTTDPDAAADERLGHWVERNEAQVRRCEQLLVETDTTSSPDLAMLSVGLRELRNLRSATV